MSKFETNHVYQFIIQRGKKIVLPDTKKKTCKF
jgi:hypothetical protein